MDEQHGISSSDSTSLAEEDFAVPKDVAEEELSVPAIKEGDDFTKEASEPTGANKSLIDKKIDEMYFGPHRFKADVSVIEAYKECGFYGPKIGEVDVVDKESGETVRVEIHKAKGRAQEPDQEGFFLIRPDGQRIGDLYLRRDLPDGAMDKNNYGPGWDHDHFFEEDYGNGEQRVKRPAKVFVEMAERDRYIGGKYENIGKLLTEIAVERSLQLGADGKVLLQAAFNSFGFWEKMGFVPQDVYNQDGSLHHAGEDLSKKYQDRVEQMLEIFAYRIKEGAGAEEIEAEKAKIIKECGALDLQYGDLAIMYLPQEAIEKYKEDILKRGPHITANRPTIQALDIKQSLLQHQGFERKQLDELLKRDEIKTLLSLEVTEGNYNEFYHLEKVAQLYGNVGDADAAQKIYEKLALAGEVGLAWENKHNHGYFSRSQATEVAEFWENAGQREKALKFWEYAGEAALSRGETDMAAIFFGRAGRQDKAGQVLEQSGEVYRDW
ncbi:MAG: hypothetical protein WC246_00810 [Candidatus Paceibacterota bacterium]